jgi:hypothetical protein
MESSTLGNQRANRRSHRNGAVCRFLAALGASVILGFGVGAPIAAARAPAAVPLHEGGRDTGPGNQRNEQLRGVRDRGMKAGSSPPEVHPPVTTPTTAPPVSVPSVTGPPPAGPSGATAAARTVPLNAASANVAAASTGNGGAPGAGPPQRAPSPPLAAPATTPRSPVARALRTARSYGALLALAAAVVIFLLVQGRLDRRDPRILSAPAEDGLSFRDFE